jgi:RecA-family ATPase
MDTETTRLSEIQEEKVEFLTFPYIALGKLSLITGDPNVGKTHLALAIASSVTTGEPLPWELERGKIDPADVIFESMEDGYGDTVKPRLLRLGADCERVHVINEGLHPLTLDDPRIERAIVKTGAKLVIFDPLTAYCNGFEMSNSGGIRPILTQLADVAARTNCAIVAICRLNKGGGKSQYRTLGSIDI